MTMRGKFYRYSGTLYLVYGKIGDYIYARNMNTFYFEILTYDKNLVERISGKK